MYLCCQVQQPPHLDGRVDTQPWNRAERLPFRIPGADTAPLFGGWGVLLWDRHALYIGVEFADQDIFNTAKEHDAKTWTTGDVCEVFVKPRQDHPSYFEYHVTPDNVTLDLMIPERSLVRGNQKLSWQELISYESGFETAVHVDREAQKWSVTMAIPFSAFAQVTAPPTPGSEWTFTLCRYDYTHTAAGELAEPVLTCTAPLPRADFHHYEGYSKLIFKEQFV